MLLGATRPPIRPTLQQAPPGLGLSQGIIARPIGALFLVAKAGGAEPTDMADDRLGVHLKQYLIADPQLIQPDHVLGLDTRAFDQGREDLSGFGNIQVRFQ